MGYRSLRVFNEDRVEAGEGFPPHTHRDMEILTWVLAGALEHRDSMGNGAVIRPGILQAMSAGTGISHSEMNHSEAEPVHFVQIWLVPEKKGLTPSYCQATFPENKRLGTLCRIASRDGGDAGGPVRIHQDAHLYASLLEEEDKVEYQLAPGRHAYIQVLGGKIAIHSETLSAGDGAAISDDPIIAIEALTDAEFLLFDLA